MASIRSGLIAILILCCLEGVAFAQTAGLPQDPFSELAQSFDRPAYAPRELQPIRQQRWRRPERARYDQKPQPSRAKSAGPGRIIRAKAEVTIIDRDHVVVTLTRHGIGDVGAASDRVPLSRER